MRFPLNLPCIGVLSLGVLFAGSACFAEPLAHGLTSSAATPSQTEPLTSPNSSQMTDAVQLQLKSQVMGSSVKLPGMDPSQKRIFDEEVVPAYALFIRDFKRVGEIVEAAIDLDGIKNLIRFSAQKSLNQPQAKILLSINAGKDCEKCMIDAPDIRKQMQLRAERRGLTPVWVSAPELVGTTLSDLGVARKAVGYLQVDLIPAPEESVDSAHADEKKFISSVKLEVRGICSYEDRVELFDTDSFETETQKLLTHAWTELGAKADLAGVAAAAKDDLLIEVVHIADFKQFSLLKALLQSRLKGLALVDERKMTRGIALFALKTKKSMDEVKAVLVGARLDDLKEVVSVGSHSNTIQMEIR